MSTRQNTMELTEAETHRVTIMADQLANLNDDEFMLWMIQVGKITEGIFAQDQETSSKYIDHKGLAGFVEYSKLAVNRCISEGKPRS